MREMQELVSRTSMLVALLEHDGDDDLFEELARTGTLKREHGLISGKVVQTGLRAADGPRPTRVPCLARHQRGQLLLEVGPDFLHVGGVHHEQVFVLDVAV